MVGVPLAGTLGRGLAYFDKYLYYLSWNQSEEAGQPEAEAA